jgi:hypothetical protein
MLSVRYLGTRFGEGKMALQTITLRQVSDDEYKKNGKNGDGPDG